jgi:hypothetical protein
MDKNFTSSADDFFKTVIKYPRGDCFYLTPQVRTSQGSDFFGVFNVEVNLHTTLLRRKYKCLLTLKL